MNKIIIIESLSDCPDNNRDVIGIDKDGVAYIVYFNQFGKYWTCENTDTAAKIEIVAWCEIPEEIMDFKV